jgi:hypothetical protein
MKKYKYVVLTLNGHSYEIDGKDLNKKYQGQAPQTELNRFLEEGWVPIREIKLDWFIHGWFRKEHYPYLVILLEKDVPSSAETGIQNSFMRVATKPTTD